MESAKGTLSPGIFELASDQRIVIYPVDEAGTNGVFFVVDGAPATLLFTVKRNQDTNTQIDDHLTSPDAVQLTLQ